MPKRLLVEGLDWGVTDAQLARAFAPFGDLEEAKIAQDWETGRSRGFGYVTFKDSGDAESALAGLDGQKLAGKSLRVMVAPEQSGTRPPSSYRSGDFGNADANKGQGNYRSADFTPPGAQPRTDRKVYRSADFGYVETKAPPAAAAKEAAADPARPSEPVPAKAPAAKQKPTPGAELEQEEEVNRAKYGGWKETDDNDGGVNRGGGGKTFG